MSSVSSPPPRPEPDSKDWTWVINEPCAECGFDAGTLQASDVADEIRTNAPRWVAVLERPDSRERPSATVWSPLEYACHVRDVYRLFARRLHLMLTEDGPDFANWDQDETAVAERYDLADPAAVSGELVAAADAMAAALDAVGTDQWDRTGIRSDGAAFTVDTFALYLLHDPVHHLHDVGYGSA